MTHPWTLFDAEDTITFQITFKTTVITNEHGSRSDIFNEGEKKNWIQFYLDIEFK